MIDANGAVLSLELAKRAAALASGLNGVEVEMHPDQVAAWENLATVVSVVTLKECQEAIPMLKDSSQRTFAGHQVRVSCDYPNNEISFVSKARPRTADGELLPPLIAAQIINLGLPDAI